MDDHHGPTHRFHKFDPANAGMLTSEERARVLPLGQVLDLLDPRPGQTVADVGCGPGFFALPVARGVAPDGRVLALDIAPEMLALLRERMTAEGVGNVEPLLSQESQLPLQDGACDRVLLAYLLHELAEPAAFFAEVARVLRPGGRGLALDWHPRESPFGPPLDTRVPPGRAAAWLQAAGLDPAPAADIGAYAYAVVFRKGGEAGRTHEPRR